ncbi:ComEA family DNA-binding protein [Streptomyces sp. NPDC005566]|uniref:ComEA family DNA-binding protein n=1 Tax=Streptomyces sp. NPDC005566 TaxID=3156886 RepID=UPI00339FBB39
MRGARTVPSWSSASTSAASPAAARATAEPEQVRGAPPVSGGTTAVSRWWRAVGPALRDRLPLWVRLRCGLEPKALAALALVLAGAAALAAVHFWSARPQPVHAPEQVKEAAAAHAAAPGSFDSSGGPGLTPGPSAGPPFPAAMGGQIVVDVSGKVRRPGIQRLPAGSRVADALRAAGGVREGTDVTALNRARVLTDGEQVVVGVPAVQPAAGGSADGTAGGGGGRGGQVGPPTPVSLTTATVEQLETLPGVGPVLAQHIVDYRTEHGGYRSVDELREVNGIGDRRFEDLRPLVRP